jgi:hypothetical protein
MRRINSKFQNLNFLYKFQRCFKFDRFNNESGSEKFHVSKDQINVFENAKLMREGNN